MNLTLIIAKVKLVKKKAPISKDKKQAKKPITNKEKDKQKDVKRPQPQKKAKPALKEDKVVKEN